MPECSVGGHADTLVRELEVSVGDFGRELVASRDGDLEDALGVLPSEVLGDVVDMHAAPA